MKRIITVGDKKFLIEGEYHPRRNFNYRVYDEKGNRPFEAGFISVNGGKKPLCVSIAFRTLTEANRWLEDGCPVRRGLELIWAAHSKAADAILAGARGGEGDFGGLMEPDVDTPFDGWP